MTIKVINKKTLKGRGALQGDVGTVGGWVGDEHTGGVCDEEAMGMLVGIVGGNRTGDGMEGLEVTVADRQVA